MTRLLRAARILLAHGLACGLAVGMAGMAGCASLGGSPEGASDAASAPAGAAPLKVQVKAPAGLDALLRQHLDVIRLSELARGERVEPAELDRLVGAVPAQVRELLQTEGYFDPKVTLDRQGDRLTVQVDPGPQAQVGRVTVEVQGPIAEQAEAGDAFSAAMRAGLQLGWPLPEGSPFRNADWETAKETTLARLRAAGYAAAAWLGTAAEVDTAARSVRIFVVVDSGPLFKAGPLEIRGLERHDEQTIRNLAGFKSGDALTESLMLDFQDRLRQAGLFDAVSVRFDTDPAQAEAAPVRVRVTESPRQDWTLGVGISADTGPRASVEHLHRRPFGWAAIARNQFEWGRLRQAWNGEVSTHPLKDQYRWLVGGEIERLVGDDDIVLSQKLRFGRAQNLPRMDRFSFVELERSSRHLRDPAAAEPKDDVVALTLNQHATFRRLDDNLLPTRGQALSVELGVGRAQSTLGETGSFGRVLARWTMYRPVGDTWYGQLRLEAGQVFRRDTVRVPEAQLFRAGGDDSVRGYSYRSLGPEINGAVAGGDALFTSSIELARPILQRMPSLWGAVFVDAGRAAESFADLNPALGYGVGVRWRSPVGPLRLDYAWAHETGRGRIHFSVGVVF